MRTDPTGIGNFNAAMVIMALIKQGHTILLPFGEGERYDFVLDRDDRLERVQAKGGVLRKGAVLFNACSGDRRSGQRKSYRGQVELFGVYCKELDCSYLVPVIEVPITAGSLRVDFPRNNQTKKVRWAKDYQI